jgi:dTDP-glucose 4,6-dehydratase
MRSVLVTGGAGFIGSNFVRYLLQAEPEARVINLDVLTYAGNPDNLRDLPSPERHTFVQGDICDRALVDQLMHQHQVDTIVHFAAETHVDRSILYPEQFLRTNVVGTFTLLEAARQYWLVEKAIPLEQVRFHHVSTDEVFGSLALTSRPGPRLRPMPQFALFGLQSRQRSPTCAITGIPTGCPYTITNCSNNYGPYQFPEKLIPLDDPNALEGRPLPVYGDGQQIRDWLYVEDHCEAIHLVVTRRPGTGETYNIGGDNQSQPDDGRDPARNPGRAARLAAFAPHRQLIQFVTDRPGTTGAMPWTSPKSHRAGLAAAPLAGHGLLQDGDWYVSHPEWIEAIRQKPIIGLDDK